MSGRLDSQAHDSGGQDTGGCREAEIGSRLSTVQAAVTGWGRWVTRRLRGLNI